MIRPNLLLAVAILSAVVAIGWTNGHDEVALSNGDETPVDYLMQVKPILKHRCYACHGSIKQEGGLRLDTAAFAMQGGDSGPAIYPGNAASSLLLDRISSHEESTRMPLEGEALTNEQIKLIRAWIEQGGAAPDDEEPEADPSDHWAFQTIRRPPIPIEFSEWSDNPLDTFISAQHRALGLTPQFLANHGILVRRLYLDLIGMPPTVEEMRQIELDMTTNIHDDHWYNLLVERLLADPRYGERWARHWMDILRYSDWWGLGDQLRNSQYHLWHWRDWIIESLNSDVPYDEMIRQMLAADELYPDQPDKVRATGFLARHWYLFNRHSWLEETVEHVNKSLLGLTMNCAKCHDHKYDPFEQEDFYRMRAFFEPYHVRLDMVPGEMDLNRNAIPRVFDGLPDQQTYFFIRGDESHPNASIKIEPGVPKILQFKDVAIEKVTLPAVAWQPERQPWVVENALVAAQKQAEHTQAAIPIAERRLDHARQMVETFRSQMVERSQQPEEDGAQKFEAFPGGRQARLVEDFTSPISDDWKLVGGDWEWSAGVLRQRLDGPIRSAVRLVGEAPTDFEASLRYTLRGGSQWRSVGIEFDATGAPPESALQRDSQLVYLSGYAGGPKLQAAFSSNDVWTYPNESQRAFSVETDRSYSLRIRVRGNLINAYVDDQLLLTYRTPRQRQQGYLQFITFDAQADFHELQVSELPWEIMMVEPEASLTSEPSNLVEAEKYFADAEAELLVAKLSWEAAQAEREGIEARRQAWQYVWQSEDDSAKYGVDPKSGPVHAAIVAAIRAERKLALARAKQYLAQAERRLLSSPADQVESVKSIVQSARDDLSKADSAYNSEMDSDAAITKFEGARWTPTRFVNSTADDPRIDFRSESTGRRRAFAEWITDPRNPLTARVAVNHLWNRHFGKPIVSSVFDFGRNGAKPANQELLDWLASELIESGWSMKHLHRLIVTSSTYRMSSSNQNASEYLEKDPDNFYWWRRNPIRLESQVIRDSILRLADQLDLSMYGPSITAAEQLDSKRRSIYFFHSNNDRNSFLMSFDEASVRECYRRDESIVPQQALAVTNSRLVFESAERMAGVLSKHLKREAQSSSTDDNLLFVRRAFKLVLGVEPSRAEEQLCQQAWKRWQIEQNESADRANAFLIWSLFNHNDFVTLR